VGEFYWGDMKIVLVEWDDSASGSSWVRRDTKEHIDSCISIGVLAREDSQSIEIIPNLTNELKLHQIVIPKTTIKRMRRLRL